MQESSPHTDAPCNDFPLTAELKKLIKYNMNPSRFEQSLTKNETMLSSVFGIEGQRPNSKIYVDVNSGHRYHFSTKRGNTWYVKCPERTCSARGKMMVLNEVFDSFSLVVMRPHNHLPRKDFPLIADLKKRIKDRVLYESTDIRFIFDEECRKSDPEIAAKLDYQSMSSSLRKARTKFLSSGAPLATSSQLQPLHQQVKQELPVASHSSFFQQ